MFNKWFEERKQKLEALKKFASDYNRDAKTTGDPLKMKVRETFITAVILGSAAGFILGRFTA